MTQKDPASPLPPLPSLPSLPSLIVGIDLGTTYSLVALLQDGRPVVLPNAMGEYLTPSAVSVADDGAVLVGTAARARATTHPGQTALAFKRDMGTDKVYDLGSRQFRPEELSALVLAELKRDAEAALGREVEEAVVTVPAYFGDAQRQATRDAALLAGLKVERIINEPTAAALAYGLSQRHRELRALVLDLGGGTFDVTVLEILEGVIEIQSSAGDARLGGEEFDAALAAHVADTVARLEGHDLRREPQTAARLKEAAERVKRRLSDAETARLALPQAALGEGRRAEVELEVTRAEVEALWAPLLARMSGPIQRALRDARLRPEQIDEVLLVGGATRMPCVARLAAQIFGRLPLRHLPPDEAVALGAAVQAGLKAGAQAVEDMVVTDVAPFTMGIAAAERFGAQIVTDIFTPMIERGTVIPCSRVKTFATMDEHQTEIRIAVYQGEHATCKDNRELGHYVIRGLTPTPGGQHLDVRFTYDLNGILEVDVMLPAEGRTETLVIEKTPGRLTGAQLAEARARMARLKFHPREALPNVTVLGRADALHVELQGAAREALQQEIARFRAALETQDEATITSCRQRLVTLMESLRRD